METVASRGRQWRRKLEEEVPVHGDGDGAFVVLPGGVQVRPRQVGGIKSPSRLCRRKPSGIVHPGMARITPEFINLNQHEVLWDGSSILPSPWFGK